MKRSNAHLFLRACGWSSGLLLLACLLACMGAPFRGRAVYGPNLEFRAITRRGAFDEVIWSDLDKRRPVCPIVLHLPEGDLGDAEFRSVKAMIDLGGREQAVEVGRGQPKLRVTHVLLEQGTVLIDATYHDDRLVSLRARVSEETRLTIQGKAITLPLAREEMVQTFGRPAQLIE